MRQYIGRLTNSGFTLIEALIAATVLAVGMLGNAAMLLRSLQANRMALQRTQAVALAADMADRMRADRLAAACSRLRQARRSRHQRRRAMQPTHAARRRSQPSN